MHLKTKYIYRYSIKNRKKQKYGLHVKKWQKIQKYAK